jgi:hypothetical protein
VLLGRPALKDLKISIDNLNDSWEFGSLPHVKKVSPSRFDREILDGTRVFEVQVVYKPVSKDSDEELKEEERENLPVAAERRQSKGSLGKREGINPEGLCNNKVSKNKNLSSGERRRRKRNCPGGQSRNGESGCVEERH